MPVGIPSAAAAPCPDVEVVLATGTSEPPGGGDTGQAFVDSLRSRLGNRSVGVYAINYPASLDFPTAADGVMDASSHVQSMAANCPATEMVLGGYSQGAAVIGYITSDACPPGTSRRRAAPARCRPASPTTSRRWHCSADRPTTS